MARRRPKTSEGKYRPVTYWLGPEVVEAVKKRAALEDRTASAVVERLLKTWIAMGETGEAAILEEVRALWSRRESPIFHDLVERFLRKYAERGPLRPVDAAMEES